MMWAVKRGRHCRLFYDMMAAAAIYNGAKVGSQLWKLCPDGWLMISHMVPPITNRRQANRPMNREVLVAEGGN